MARNTISIEIKKTCLELSEKGLTSRQVYNEYFKQQFETPTSYESFRRYLKLWKKQIFPDDTTLKNGTYEGFIAHGATVQVSKNGEIVQAWIKQKAGDFDPEEFLSAIKESVEPCNYKLHSFEDSFNMLEIPLFDMHWGLGLKEYYEPVLQDLLYLVNMHHWEQIVIPFGQDFFHNDSIVSAVTTKGTAIEKVDMTQAVKDGKWFMYSLIDAAIRNADEVKVIYTPGNHDLSISWMFVQVLLERYGADVVDDSLEYRKVIAYGKNSIMFTHGDSKQATPKNLAHIFPITFPNEFATTNIREVHAGHLHHEGEADIYGVMVRRLSSGTKDSDWSDREDYIGAHKRFMVFEWGPDKLKSIHYV